MFDGQALTDQFYAWEVRGRGWLLWDFPVGLEPPFSPFYFQQTATASCLDDARRPTRISSWVEGVGNWLRPKPRRVDAPEPDTWAETVWPEAADSAEPHLEIQLVLPPELKTEPEETERFLMALRYFSCPVSFEIVGTSETVTVQVACRAAHGEAVREQLAAHFPDVICTERRGLLKSAWAAGPGGGLVVDFGLSREFVRPLRTGTRFDPDPLVTAVGAMQQLRPGEVAVLQVLFQPVACPWAEHALRATATAEELDLFLESGDLAKQARKKLARPLYAAVVRVAAQGVTPERTWQLARAVGGSLAQFGDPAGNEFIPLTNEEYDGDLHEADLLARSSHRSGMLLNSEELVWLVHPPSASVRSAKLMRETTKSKAAPDSATGHALVLGENTHAGLIRPVTVSPAVRLRHMHVVGGSGTGKTTFLLNCILQDIEAGRGVAVLDPHGDLIDEILGRVPPSRLDDVVLVDPADEEFPVGFNILHAHSELEKNLIASDLVAVFRRLSTSWGDQMNSVLANGILAILESERGGTLSDLRRFLVDDKFRKALLATVPDREIRYYWQKEFPLLSGRPQAPLLTRLDIFLRPKPIRHMVSQRENRIDFSAIMNEGKIFLGKLSQGMIGEENSYLLGSLLVSKFYQLAIARQAMKEADRREFYLYLDEFHHFITPTMATILSGARKYGLGLVLAHQDLRQLASRSDEVTSAVLSNPATRVCFCLGDEDARKLAAGLSFFEARDLQNLGRGEAVVRLERAEHDFNLRTFPLPAIDGAESEERRRTAVELTRARFATPKQDVQEALEREWEQAEAARNESDEEKPKRSRSSRRAASVPQAEIAPDPPPLPIRETPVLPIVTNGNGAGEDLAEICEGVKIASVVPPPAPEPQTVSTTGPPMIQRLPAQGRGGAKHKHLQRLIKSWGDGMGYRATIEKEILDGAGSVDVALEKEGRSIACEISITTDCAHELGNVEKCLAAGFDYVVAISSDEKRLEKLKCLVATGTASADAERVRVCTPDEFFAFANGLEAASFQRVRTVRGYKVTLDMDPVELAEHRAKEKVITEVIGKSMLQMKRREKGGR